MPLRKQAMWGLNLLTEILLQLHSKIHLGWLLWFGLVCFALVFCYFFLKIRVILGHLLKLKER